MIDFNNLQRMENKNTRVNYDMRYSSKTGRFNLSQSAFDKFDIQNNGFVLHRYGNTVIFQVVPNEQADLHSGREGKNKGLSFTAKSVVYVMGLQENTNFNFKVHKHEGKTFLAPIMQGDVVNNNEPEENEELELAQDNEEVYAETETTNEIY